jgi:hypothetical protein
MAASALGLTFLWEFLSPIFSDAIKARLKPPTSSEAAKDRAFQLYQKLEDVDQKTDMFVSAFQAFAALALKASSEDQRQSKRAELRQAAQDLMYSLPELADALDRVNPQLEIHQHDLVQTIEQYRHSRALLLTKLEESVDSAADQNVETIQQLVNTAESNRQLIKRAIHEMRVFLAAEFPFKEGF